MNSMQEMKDSLMGLFHSCKELNFSECLSEVCLDSTPTGAEALM